MPKPSQMTSPKLLENTLLKSVMSVAVGCSILLPVMRPAATETMPLSEVRPGMQGVGVTVFEGSTLPKFAVHILGVLTNVMGTRRDLIVARLEGGPLSNTGVIQGMSGSPVYIDDRLIGAVSYSLGSFSKDAIAGITPIDEMIETDSSSSQMARRHLRLPLDSTPTDISDTMREAFRTLEPFAHNPRNVSVSGIPNGEARHLATMLRPISTPIVLNGFVPHVHDIWASMLNHAGFTTAVGGLSATGITQTNGSADLQPGDPVGVMLMRGDLTMAGTGTVTFVEDQRVYAFGHPFYNLGAAQFPMTTAKVTTLLPSLAISSRIAEIGDVLGTIDQDRATGIYGSIGTEPTMIPVSVTLETPGNDEREVFRFEIINNELFTPLLTYTGVLNTLFSWTQEIGAGTYDITTVARLENQPSVSFQNMYTGSTAAISAALSTATPLTTLLSNTLDSVTVERIDVAVTAYEAPRVATLQRAWLDTNDIRPGETIALHILTRSDDGTDQTYTLDLDIPRHITGTAVLLVADAITLEQEDAQTGRHVGEIASIPQLIDRLSTRRKNNRLYVQLLSPQPGAIVQGNTFESLPPSILAVLEADAGSGALTKLTHSQISEWELPTDWVVSGSRRLAVTIGPE